MDIPTTEYKEKMRSDRRSAPLLFIPAAALVFLAFLSSAPLYGQIKKDTLTFRIMGYNVENLFDCRHDTLKTITSSYRMLSVTGIILNTRKN